MKNHAMTIDQFLKAFEKRVKAEKDNIVWFLRPTANIGHRPVPKKPSGGLRLRGKYADKKKAAKAAIDNPGYCCPIAFLDGKYTSIAFGSAIRNLGMNALDGGQIIMAADEDPGHDPVLRARLLEITGLTNKKKRNSKR